MVAGEGFERMPNRTDKKAEKVMCRGNYCSEYQFLHQPGGGGIRKGKKKAGPGKTVRGSRTRLGAERRILTKLQKRGETRMGGTGRKSEMGFGGLESGYHCVKRKKWTGKYNPNK